MKIMKNWPRERESVLDVYNLILAIVLFVSPLLFTFKNETAKIDLWVSASVIAALSIGAIVAYANWAEWANLLLGLWLVVSPWLLGFTHTRAMHFSIVIGATVAYLALIEIWLRYDAAHFGPNAQDHLSQHEQQ